MPKTVFVRAAIEGRTVPMEGAPKRHIGAEPVRVALSPYYRRQIRDGDLLVVHRAPSISTGDE